MPLIYGTGVILILNFITFRNYIDRVNFNFKIKNLKINIKKL